MSETPEVKPKKKAKKKKPDALALLAKEYKQDGSDLRFVLFLSRESGLPYQQIDLKKYEVLVFLLKDYINRKTKDKAKQINKLMKETFSKTNVEILKTIQNLAATEEGKELIMKDIIRAFGDPANPESIAAKALNDIYTFPTKVYNCAYEPPFLLKKLYEFNGKTLSKQIYSRVAGKPNDGAQFQASHFYVSGLNRNLLETETYQN